MNLKQKKYLNPDEVEILPPALVPTCPICQKPWKEIHEKNLRKDERLFKPGCKHFEARERLRMVRLPPDLENLHRNIK